MVLLVWNLQEKIVHLDHKIALGLGSLKFFSKNALVLITICLTLIVTRIIFHILSSNKFRIKKTVQVKTTETHDKTRHARFSLVVDLVVYFQLSTNLLAFSFTVRDR